MIQQARAYAEKQKREAEECLAALDSDFKIDVVRGVHVQHFVRNIQPGRSA